MIHAGLRFLWTQLHPQPSSVKKHCGQLLFSVLAIFPLLSETCGTSQAALQYSPIYTSFGMYPSETRNLLHHRDDTLVSPESCLLLLAGSW